MLLFGLYGIAISRWSGKEIRFSSNTLNYDIKNRSEQYSRVTLINPTSRTIQVKVRPACGCVVVLNHPKEMIPFVPYFVNVELHPDSLVAKPGYMQLVEFECQSGRQKWVETLEVRPFKNQ